MLRLAKRVLDRQYGFVTYTFETGRGETPIESIALHLGQKGSALANDSIIPIDQILIYANYFF